MGDGRSEMGRGQNSFDEPGCGAGAGGIAGNLPRLFHHLYLQHGGCVAGRVRSHDSFSRDRQSGECPSRGGHRQCAFGAGTVERDAAGGRFGRVGGDAEAEGVLGDSS